MRFTEFNLLEYDQSKTLAAYGAKLSQDPNQARAILANIEAIDPTRNKQYVVWLVKQHLASQPVLDNAAEVTKLLTNFERLKPRLDQKDINQYSLEQLSAAITAVLNPKLGVDTQGKYEVPDGATVLYNGPLGLLTKPTSHRASCELGSGTKWCTTEKSPINFIQYSTYGDLYVWRDRSGEKYQFWISTDAGESEYTGNYVEIKDDKNKKLSIEAFKKIKINPVISKFLKYLEQQLQTTFPSGEYKENWYFETNDIAAIAADPKLSFKYATSVLRGPFPAGEAAIYSDEETTAKYKYFLSKLKNNETHK